MSFVQILKRGAASNLRATVPKRAYSGAMTSEEVAATKVEADEAVHTWKKISLFVTVPLCAIFGYIATEDELHHISHLKEHPPTFTKYQYISVHRKDFPWGDGKETLFFNPLVNLPVE
ncbi:Cytochrome c oxidase subunit 6A, mitochondrial [Smittium mucronatum]|uniref:Cytochrome c oxidase subunit 6A, mitochondrial n=1 Tax=Smittium mucronatum TaxID=133383 RepID=A0A1R0GUR2_9FUNG|nr:Cytochrome c oxidase subunit 6A, mitochondrial [Smittium mucronatum]